MKKKVYRENHTEKEDIMDKVEKEVIEEIVKPKPRGRRKNND